MFIRLLAFTFLLCIISMTSYGKVYYVSPTGNDGNAGTFSAPFLTIQQAQSFVSPGDTIYIRGGTYTMQSSQIAAFSGTNPVYAYVTNLNKSGTAGNLINYWAYPGEKPLFDYTNVKPANTRINAFEVSGSWIYIKGLEVVGVQVTTPDPTINTQSICFSNTGVGGNNIYEQLSMHDGMAVGFYLTRGGNNLILNCDAYNNWDSISNDKTGGNVDGFGCHPNSASYTGNVFRGCRAWYNSDDGFDCIQAFADITFENCWSWRNGYSLLGQSLANGNGFKVGGFGVSSNPNFTDPQTVPRHTVRFCMAANNKTNGFYANHHLGGSNWYNNTGYRNSVNFDMLNRSQDFTQDVPGYSHVLRNNVSYSSRSTNGLIADYDINTCTIDHNSFLNPNVTLGAADFVSLDTSLVRTARQADGSLPIIPLLRLASNSDMIDAGIDVGLPYNGTQPDLGAFETNLATAGTYYWKGIVGSKAAPTDWTSPANWNTATDGFGSSRTTPTTSDILIFNGNLTSAVENYVGPIPAQTVSSIYLTNSAKVTLISGGNNVTTTSLNINSGRLLVNSTTGNSGLNTGAIIVPNNAILGGTGFVSGAIEINFGGKIQPGADTFPGQDKALADNTHFNSFGAYEIAKCVVEGIRKNHLGLEEYLQSIPTFDPNHPDLPEKFDLPPSPGIGLVKPDGN